MSVQDIVEAYETRLRERWTPDGKRMCQTIYHVNGTSYLCSLACDHEGKHVYGRVEENDGHLQLPAGTSLTAIIDQYGVVGGRDGEIYLGEDACRKAGIPTVIRMKQ